MALDFPASPVIGQTFNGAGGVVWTWDGAKWNAASFAVAGPYLPLTGGTLTGPVVLPANPTIALQAATKQYVDAAFNDVGRNLIHNSMFNIVQRGTGPWTDNALTADRWNIERVTDTISYTVAALSDGARTQIGDEAAAQTLQNVFTGDAAAGSRNALLRRIEGVRRLGGKTVTVSFWATAGSVLKLGMNIAQVFGSGGSPSAGLWVQATGASFTLSTVWTRYSATFSLPSTSGKTLGTNYNDYTQLTFAFSSGATSNATYGNVGVQSGVIAIWGVQLEIGSTATPLEKLDPVTQLQQCQRFYQVGQVVAGGFSAAVVTVNATLALPVTMRVAPIIAITGSFDGALTSPTQQVISGTMLLFGGTTPSTGSGWGINRQFTVSADL